jgi:hypothetical protein
MFKVATMIAVLLGITLMVLPAAHADVLICNNEHIGATEAHVVIPPATRASFIRYVEKGFPDHHFGLRYNGGVGYKESITLDLSDQRSGNIGVVVESKTPNSEFTAWIQTCNTRSSWKPYWKALIHALRAFPGAKVTETPFKR